MKPTILTCSVVGAGPLRKDNPAIPYSPAEIAQQAVEAANAGASVVHLHVRDPETGAPSIEFKHYKEVVDRIRDAAVDVIINLTTGPGARFQPKPDSPREAGPLTNIILPEQRCEHVCELKPDICSLDLNTLLGRNGTTATINLTEHVTRIAELVQAEGVKPELEVFGPGDIVLAQDLMASGVLKGRQLFQMVLGTKYGAPASTQMMQAMQAMLPEDSEWAAFGIGRLAYPMLAQSVLLGGHARMGFEDNIYMKRGVLAPGNGAMIEKAARLIEDLGGTVATPSEAREILGLKTCS